MSGMLFTMRAVQAKVTWRVRLPAGGAGPAFHRLSSRASMAVLWRGAGEAEPFFLRTRPDGHGTSSGLLLLKTVGLWRAVRTPHPHPTPVLTAERLNLGGCRWMSCLSQEKVHNGPGTIKLWRFMLWRLGSVCSASFPWGGGGRRGAGRVLAFYAFHCMHIFSFCMKK